MTVSKVSDDRYQHQTYELAIFAFFLPFADKLFFTVCLLAFLLLFVHSPCEVPFWIIFLSKKLLKDFGHIWR